GLAGGAIGPAGGVSGGVVPGAAGGPPGIGKGLGTAPVDAQAMELAARASVPMMSAARQLAIRIMLCCGYRREASCTTEALTDTITRRLRRQSLDTSTA